MNGSMDTLKEVIEDEEWESSARSRESSGPEVYESQFVDARVGHESSATTVSPSAREITAMSAPSDVFSFSTARQEVGFHSK